jgi:hypothetical protein
MPKTVDEYIADHIAPQHQPIVARLRDIMRDAVPDAAEVISYNMLCWKGRKRLIAHIAPSATRITLGFIGGIGFDDPYGLLEGKGKATRHVKIKSLDALPEAAVRDYARQAAALEAAQA